jgi:hypothetical protein
VPLRECLDIREEDRPAESSMSRGEAAADATGIPGTLGPRAEIDRIVLQSRSTW